MTSAIAALVFIGLLAYAIDRLVNHVLSDDEDECW